MASVLAYDFFRESFIDNYCCCFHCNYARYHYLSFQIHSPTYLLLWKQSVDDISRASAPSDFLLGSLVGSFCRLAGKDGEGLGLGSYSPALRAPPPSFHSTFQVANSIQYSRPLDSGTIFYSCPFSQGWRLIGSY